MEDLQLESSVESSCSISVLDAHKAILSSDNSLLQEFNSTLMEVTVRDVRGIPFDLDQYKYMTIHLTIDTDSEYLKQSALKITNYQGKMNVFLVEGVITGYYLLVASVLNNRYD